MKAMILAAGRGERLRPLTDSLPKPLLSVGKYRLIEWHIHRLVDAGIQEMVINVSHLGDLIREQLGNGERYGAHIEYSQEPEPALETAGGIIQALDLLGSDPFIVINGDIWTDYPLQNLHPPERLAHLVLVDNPAHHRQGDFYLQDSMVSNQGQSQRYTFSGLGVYRQEMFSAYQPGRLALAPVLIKNMQSHQVTGEYYSGHWYDIGTPERLQTIEDFVAENENNY